MARRDTKQFMLGFIIGALLPWTPKMFPDMSFLASVTSFIPDLVTDFIPEGVQSYLVVGDPTLLSVVLHGVILGLILMLFKK